MKRIFVILGLCSLPMLVFGQIATDALRYSTFDVTGTARSVGVAGSMGALGTDFAVLSTNPAGLGAYRWSKFTFTPAVFDSKISSLLEGNDKNVTNTERDYNININNVGLVIASLPNGSKWKTINFGVGFNRLANYNQRFFYSGESEGSITDRFVELADGFTADQLDDFEAGLAYDAGAIWNNDPDDLTFYTNDFLDGELVERAQVVRTSGNINELVFSLAGNYDEKLMIGTTIGVPFLSFEENKNYEETDEDDSNPVFDRLEYNEFLRTTGTGINFKFGFIYRAHQLVRIGGAIHTPTFFNLEDEFSTTMDYAYFDNFGNLQEPLEPVRSPSGLYDYKLRTPWRLFGNAAVLLGKNGFLSGEVEWVDYSSSAFNFHRAVSADDEEYERDLNGQIEDGFQANLNVRLGGELRYEIFRFRGGYLLSTSQFVGDDNIYTGFSAGLGIDEKKFFMDLAYRRTTTGETYIPYVTASEPQQSITNDGVLQRYLLTIGFKF